MTARHTTEIGWGWLLRASPSQVPKLSWCLNCTTNAILLENSNKWSRHRVRVMFRDLRQSLVAPCGHRRILFVSTELELQVRWCYVDMILCWHDAVLTWCYVDMMLCWHDAVLTWCYVDMMLCWHDVMLTWYYVDMMLCWHDIMLTWCYVDMMPCWPFGTSRSGTLGGGGTLALWAWRPWEIMPSGGCSAKVANTFVFCFLFFVDAMMSPSALCFTKFVIFVFGLTSSSPCFH